MMSEEKRVTTPIQKTIDAGGREKKGEKQAGTVGDDACRCKETSKMTARELLGLMMSDLAFWKKTKKSDSGSR
jgi:hypothetical protein